MTTKDEAFNRCWSKYYKEHSWNYMDEELSFDLAYYFWKSALEQPTQEPMIIKQIRLKSKAIGNKRIQ